MVTSAKAQPALLRKDVQVPGEYKYFATQVSSGGIATGDFNGDGRPDLLVGSLGRIDVLLNSGGGSFGRSIHRSIVFSEPVATTDFNGDGKRDLVLPDASRVVGHLLLGCGDGALQQVFHGGKCEDGLQCNADAFVAKLDAWGQLVYSTFLGGSGQETVTGIALDGSGQVR